MDKLEEGRKLLPKGSKEKCIEGGNHAQFGSYGKQKGDGEARISAEKTTERNGRYIFGVQIEQMIFLLDITETLKIRKI